jgi:hypothetical protein
MHQWEMAIKVGSATAKRLSSTASKKQKYVSFMNNRETKCRGRLLYIGKHLKSQFFLHKRKKPNKKDDILRPASDSIV